MDVKLQTESKEKGSRRRGRTGNISLKIKRRALRLQRQKERELYLEARKERIKHFVDTGIIISPPHTMTLLCLILWFSGCAQAVTDFNNAAWVKVDPCGFITGQTSTKLMFTNWDNGATTLFYRDYGANWFHGDFTHKFEFRAWSGLTTSTVLYIWQLSNLVHDAYWYESEYVRAGEASWLDCLALQVIYDSDADETYIGLYRWDNGHHSYDYSTKTDWAVDTTYYVTIVRDDDANTTGYLYCDIATGNYEGFAGSVHVERLGVNLTEQNDFRYVMALSSYYTGVAAGEMSGWVQSLDVGYEVRYLIGYK